VAGSARPQGGIRAAYARARDFFVRRTVLTDLLVATAVATASIVSDLFDQASLTWAVLFDLALAVPLLWRRRRPVEAFLVVAAVALVQWITGTLAGDLAVLIALYSVAAYERRRWTVPLAAGIAGVGVALAILRWAPPGETVRVAVLLTGTVSTAWIAGIYVRTRRAYLASVLDRAATAERDRDRQAQVAVAAERSRIAREMHDVVAHNLAVMIALSDGAAASTRTDPEEATQVMQQASAVGRQALAEMRRLVGVLRSDGPGHRAPQPGDADLDDLVERVRSAGLGVDLVVTGQPGRSSAGAQLTAYRIVQESLTNVLKHAPRASRAVVTLRYDPTAIDVEIANDDLGRPARWGEWRQGHGLTGIRERAAVYGGTVHAGPLPGGGWRVATRLDLDDREVVR
jgi:signal transduction histidine kinase